MTTAHFCLTPYIADPKISVETMTRRPIAIVEVLDNLLYQVLRKGDLVWIVDNFTSRSIKGMSIEQPLSCNSGISSIGVPDKEMIASMNVLAVAECSRG